jgi:1,4-alpha-glucan branching enzyme
MLGAHLAEHDGLCGVRFAVWAPNAEVVCLVGDFNDWDARRHPMRLRDGGIWEIFIPELGEGTRYKYYVRSRHHGYRQTKADPYAFHSEVPPNSASVIANLERYQWKDAAWMEERASTDWLKKPVSVYEVHLESWLRGPDNESLTYRDFADKLVDSGRGDIKLSVSTPRLPDSVPRKISCTSWTVATRQASASS